MKFIEVLCEGSSDEPMLREILTRRFGLTEQEHFRVHPHHGKGRLPSARDRLRRPEPSHNFLLTQLPIKLKYMGRQSVGGFEVVVIVVVDADDDDCVALKTQLSDLYTALPTKPRNCLFRIAVEETESWFIADPEAVKKAFPRARKDELEKIPKDAVCGAWERLARAIGEDPSDCGGRDKYEWASAIAPHVNLENPESPSLAVLISGIARILA